MLSTGFHTCDQIFRAKTKISKYGEKTTVFIWLNMNLILNPKI